MALGTVEGLWLSTQPTTICKRQFSTKLIAVSQQLSIFEKIKTKISLELYLFFASLSEKIMCKIEKFPIRKVAQV